MQPLNIETFAADKVTKLRNVSGPGTAVGPVLLTREANAEDMYIRVSAVGYPGVGAYTLTIDDYGPDDYGDAISESSLLMPSSNIVQASWEKTGDTDWIAESVRRRFARYLSLAPLAATPLSADDLDRHRHALAKLVNSLSWHPRLRLPIALDAAGTVYRLDLRWYERGIMGLTFFVLAAVELTIAKTKPEALFFAMCVLGVGYGLRAYSHKLSGLKTVTVSRGVAAMVTPDIATAIQPRVSEGAKIMVAARGITPVLGFALDEAQLRNAVLCVLYVKEIAVYFSAAPVALGRKAKWQEDPEANAIMSTMIKEGEARGVCVLPVYAVSEDAAGTILDLSATMGVDYLIIGASQRTALAHLLRGSVVTNVAAQLPDEIRLVIFG